MPSPSRHHEFQPGQVLAGRYKIVAEIGIGGFGVVAEAQHLDLDMPVAIKGLLPKSAANPTVVQRFLKEGRSAARLHSEHVVRVMDMGILPSGAPFLVMELLKGADLGAVLRHRGQLSVGQAADIVRQACHAIDEAHHQGIVHRDLKPENLFLTQRYDGSALVKVLDFGVAKAREQFASESYEEEETGTSTLLGSPLYMAPEQIRSAKDADHRADIWALGAILYHLLTGVPPFYGESMAKILESVMKLPPTALRVCRTDLPSSLEGIIMRCLEKERSDRYQSVRQLQAALTPFANKDQAESARKLLTAPALAHELGESAPWPAGSSIDTDDELVSMILSDRKPPPSRHLTPSKPTLVFGIAPSVYGLQTTAKLAAFCDALSEALGEVVIPYTTQAYRTLLEGVERQRVHLAWLPPVLGVQGVADGLLKPLVLPLRHGRATFTTVLVCRHDSRIADLSRARGKQVAWVDQNSAGGYLVMQADLVTRGKDPAKYFSRERFCGSHPAVVRAVATGEADIGATYVCYDQAGQIMAAGWDRSGVNAANLRILHQAGPIPADLVAARSDLDPGLIARLQHILQDGAVYPRVAQAAAQLFQAERFVNPHPSHLAPLSHLLQSLRSNTRFPSVFPHE